MKKVPKKKFPPKKSIPKFEKFIKPYTTYLTRVVKGLSKAGLGEKHKLNISLINNAFGMGMSVQDCVDTYLKSLQLKLQFEKDAAKEQMSWCMEFADHVRNTQKDK